MPLTRYQIRNEFNLADPDLYRAADKDDPEALLEGVAMAGLVGLLRQLGDLAEFAAEIFHDLHEEVMATAARGHGLMARIQQLEADVPLIEKSFLSHTNHTSFYYNTGDNWHPQMCMDQNLITQGDMPRFIRDSYEECRGPPQLFLLDKFDIGGAGACLKRYTDPSSFKAEPTTSDAAKLDVQSDRRTRKVKKRGYRLKNRDTPEVMTTSHAKLHQLLLEERIQVGSKGPPPLAKLKKRLLDGSNRSKSYMEKFLQSMSPEHPQMLEMEVGTPTLRLTYNHSVDQEREIHDIQPVSATEDSVYYSPIDHNSKSRRAVRNSSDFYNRGRMKESLSSTDDGNTIEVGSHLHIPDSEKELGVDGESRKEVRVICSSSDDIASETDNYMDALANMESEGEVDNEYRPKNNLRYLSISKLGVRDPREEPQMDRDKFLDSQSIDYSNTSDDGRMSFVKENSSSSSHDAQNYARRSDVQYRDAVAERFASTETFEDVMVDYLHSPDINEAQETTSNEYGAANGFTMNSIEAPLRSDVHKEPSHLLKATTSEIILDSDFPRDDRNGIYQGADIYIDTPLNVGNNSVVQSSIQGHEQEVSMDVLMHYSNNLNLDPPGGETTEDGMHQKVYDDDISSESMTFEGTASPQSVVSDYRQQPLPKVYHAKEPFSRVTSASADHASHDGTSDISVLVGVSGESPSELEMDDEVHVLNSSHEVNGSFSVDGPYIEVKADDVNGLYTGERELAAAISLFGCVDGEGHGGSSNISLVRDPLDTVSVEEADIGCKSDIVGAGLPPDCSSPSMDGHDSQASISESDDLHLGVVQRLESGSPTYPVNVDIQTELYEVSESRIEEDASFERSDLDIKAFDDVLGQTLDNHASDRLPLDNATASTSLRMENPISEPVNHLLLTYDNSSSAPSSRDLQLCTEEAVVKMSNRHYGQLYSPEEAPAAEISSRSSSLEAMCNEEVMKEGVSVSQEREIKPEGVPPLPPMQWMLGKLQESSFDSEAKLDDSVVRPVGPLAPFTFGGKSGFPFSALDREIEQPGQIDESLQQTSVPYIGDSHNSTAHALQMKDSVDDMQSQRDFFKSQPMTIDENIESDTLDFNGETVCPSSASQLIPRDMDTSTRSEIQSSDTPNVPMPPLADTTISTGQTTQPSLLAPSMRETVEPSSTLPYHVLPPSGQTLDSKSNTSVAEVTLHDTDQSQEETTSYSNKLDQALQSSEGGAMNRPEGLGPQTGNKEAPKQENEPSEREATWSLSLPNYNKGTQVDKQAPKPPRPRNPLTESADVLDRSKLKKVMRRSQPETPQADDRGSFLEQIRAKSFNLKPARVPVTKPVIQAPSMNLKVVSILEKVKKLRRDTAGSDDENDWSDD